MPTCQHCGTEWSFKQTLKKMFTFTTAMQCPHCNEKQYYTKRARKRTALLSFASPFIILLNLFDISAYLLVGTFVLYCVFVMGVYPFLVELSNEEEPLW
nr:TIGR04104 family putative zinc finger protein [Lysinibacillus timonensis]